MQSPDVPMRGIAPDVKIGRDVVIRDFVNLYGCEIGDNSRIGTFVEIQKGACVGRNCKIQSHTFICEGVTVEDGVFIGHNVTFINDRFPRSIRRDGSLQTEEDWVCVPTLIRSGASIGSSATILCGVTIGEDALVGAGSVVVKDVPAGAVVAGNPARVLRRMRNEEPPSKSRTQVENGNSFTVDSRGSTMTHVPLLDLRAQCGPIREDLISALMQVLDSTAFAGGPFVADFEKEFASYCGCEFAVGVGSGTTALWQSLLALGIGAGDEVITTPNTFIATAEAISLCGATPVFVDVDPETFTMNPDLLEPAITPRTRAVIPVHLYGQTADMDAIGAVARRHALYVIEDACQAHGAEYKGRRAGSMGDAGCFSFYPGKNLGASGEAGAVVTNNAELAREIRIRRDHGQTEKYQHAVIGWNDRMDGFQGAVLSFKLRYLDRWNDARRRHARLYNRLLEAAEQVVLPREAAYARHAYHIYAIRVPRRDELMAALREKDIWCGVHYPIPIHLQRAYAFLGHRKGCFPVAEQCAEESLSLPMFPELTIEQIERVATEIVDFLAVAQPKVNARESEPLPGTPMYEPLAE